ncbi:P-loop containing nucleoside triphosphate hydrolase protein [Gautieria morchelliformis]|nr:P-loop containing nucleoside triphosphate hydrolase protein [Gautieria morchelliformis]
MDYYCRRFGFGKPDINFEQTNKHKGYSSWDAIMLVDGRRIGLGSGPNKKLAQIACYLDVAQYLESCDKELWNEYVEAAKTGKDVGLAPSVYFSMGDSLDSEIRDLCADIRGSALYKNRPIVESGQARSDAAIQIISPLPSRPWHSRSPQFYSAKSEQLSAKRKAYLQDPRHETMRAQRASLPVTAQAADILDQITKNDVTICMAATGSGKTTQIPQLLLDDAIDRGKGAFCNIVCTQPRRIAAISVAQRVANERGESLGPRSSIGYQVRFDAKLPDLYGSVTFCTTGIFLKRMQNALLGGASNGRSLDDVTHIVVDEVHERDVDTDLLLVVLKRLLAERKAQNRPIKIILMSATIDPTLFQEYFKNERGLPAPVIEVPGRSFPVVKHFLDETIPVLSDPSRGTSWVFREESVLKYIERELGPESTIALRDPRARPLVHPDRKDGIDDLELPHPLVALTVAHVLDISDSGHVLVFLPGWDDIITIQRILLDRNKLPLRNINFSDPSRFAIHLLHSTIPVQEQQAVFEPPPSGVRRIILATNIAETSITIPDVVYVVDTGKIKENRYDPERHMSSLVSAWVGSSNLNQRAGRAGRHRPGEYFGILGQRRAQELHPYQTVEMKRVDLSNVVMHVKALDFPGMEVEEVLAATIEPPSSERVTAAINNLKMVGALGDNKNLTSLGRVLLQLPVDVQMGRLVLLGSFFRCLDKALTLAAILTNRDPFLSPPALKKEATAVKISWTPQGFRSDALATLFAYDAWWNLFSKGHYVAANRFCNDNFLAKPTLLMMQKIKGQLLHSLYQAGVIDVSAGGTLGHIPANRDHVPPQLNTNGDSLPLLSALIATASQPKFALRLNDRCYRTARDKITFIHPSSVNNVRREVAESAAAERAERQIFAFTEKRQNVSTGSTNSQTYLMGSTRIDHLSYMLFGAYRIEVTGRGLECDEWLPIVGRIDVLRDIQRVKMLMEACMLRVFEGVSRSQRRDLTAPSTFRRIGPRDNVDAESDESDDDLREDRRLSEIEVKELDFLTRDIVSIMDRYSEERLVTQSRRTSQPATPRDSPAPSFAAYGSRSRISTPSLASASLS